MASRSQRRARSRERFLRHESDKLIRLSNRDKGIIADRVASIVKANRGIRPTVEDRAWQGQGCSSVYQPGRAISGYRMGNGKTLSVLTEGIRLGKVRGKVSDFTY